MAATNKEVLTQIGTTYVPVRKLSLQESLELLFTGAEVWKGIADRSIYGAPRVNVGLVVYLVATCVGRDQSWVLNNADLPQLIRAVQAADSINHFTEAFALLGEIGWA